MPATITVAGCLVNLLPWCGQHFPAVGQRIKIGGIKNTGYTRGYKEYSCVIISTMDFTFVCQCFKINIIM